MSRRQGGKSRQEKWEWENQQRAVSSVLYVYVVQELLHNRFKFLWAWRRICCSNFLSRRMRSRAIVGDRMNWWRYQSLPPTWGAMWKHENLPLHLQASRTPSRTLGNAALYKGMRISPSKLALLTVNSGQVTFSKFQSSFSPFSFVYVWSLYKVAIGSSRIFWLVTRQKWKPKA